MPTETAATRVPNGEVTPVARGEPGAGIGEGDAAAGDARGAGAAVGLEHVAVDLDGELAEGEGAHRGAEGAADEALDLLGASAGALALAAGALDGGAREHGVLGRHPALAGAALVRRRPGFDGRGAMHQGAAHADEAGALGVGIGAALEGDGAKLIIRTDHQDEARTRSSS